MYTFTIEETNHEYLVAERNEKGSVIQIYQFDKHTDSKEEVIAYMNKHYNANL